jgi:outer membrane protein assembly factor BamB
MQIVVNGWHANGGYDFATGKNLWTLDGGGDIPVPTPIFAHDMIYLTSAHGIASPMRAIRSDASGNITPTPPAQTNAAVVWSNPNRGDYMQTPIVVGNLLFGCQDVGIVACFDAATGEIKSRRRLASGEGFTASVVSDARNLFYTSELGNVFVVPVSTHFSVIATNELHETCMATPAISEGTLFFRTREKLLAVGAKR